MRAPLRAFTIARRTPLLAGALGALALAGPGTSAALAQGSPTPPSSTTTTPAPAPPADGRLAVRLTGPQRFGRDLVLLRGGRARVDATVAPYVAGQRLEVLVRRDGRVAQRRQVPVRPGPNGTGIVALSIPTDRTGRLVVSISHTATTAQKRFSGPPAAFNVLASSLRPGSHGAAVSYLQARLARLAYAVPRGGSYDDATGRAVLAYRKVNRLGLSESADRSVMEALFRGAGAYRVRFPRDGRHVEGDLRHQVLALVVGRRVERVYTMSSGKPSTPTVRGRFRVYMKELGTNSHGMVDSNFFYRGYAVHGYADVPDYPASHGCLRVPIPDAASIYGRIRIGEIVDVFD